MPASKIVNEQEVIRWFEEGRTYQWMMEEYRRKYNINTVPSMWGNFRRRRGLDRRINRNDDLLPWEIKREHRWKYPAVMLRFEARLREGMTLNEDQSERLESWKARLAEENAVVHYDPETKDGFFYVPKQPGEDLIHKPARKTTQRKRID